MSRLVIVTETVLVTGIAHAPSPFNDMYEGPKLRPVELAHAARDILPLSFIFGYDDLCDKYPFGVVLGATITKEGALRIQAKMTQHAVNFEHGFKLLFNVDTTSDPGKIKIKDLGVYVIRTPEHGPYEPLS